MASVCMPLGGLQQLRQSSVTDRFQHLSHAVDDALQHGYVILGGDSNAKVAGRNDVAFSDMEYVHESGMSCQRGVPSPKGNSHARLLTDLCMGSGLLLGIGRLFGDKTASPTFLRVHRVAVWVILPWIGSLCPVRLLHHSAGPL